MGFQVICSHDLGMLCGGAFHASYLVTTEKYKNKNVIYVDKNVVSYPFMEMSGLGSRLWNHCLPSIPLT